MSPPPHDLPRPLEHHDAEDMLGWDHGGGFSLDGSVQIEATDREGLDRLIRGHRCEGLVVPGPPLPSTGSTSSEDNALADPGEEVVLDLAGDYIASYRGAIAHCLDRLEDGRLIHRHEATSP